MDPAKYQRLTELFAEARALDLAARPAFLDQVGAAAQSLRAELEALLSVDADGDLDKPLQTAAGAHSCSDAAAAPEKVLVGKRRLTVHSMIWTDSTG